jgi:hypothetical protein
MIIRNRISIIYNKVAPVCIFFVLMLFLQVPASGQGAGEGGYGQTLYPYVHEYDQVLVYKIGVDYCPSSGSTSLDATEVLDIIRQIDNITRGMPKIVYLVGWQYRGHDTGFPSFGEVNEALKRDVDKTALESLRWLLQKGPEYNTLVSLHVNFSDVYLDDNPLGPLYKEKDILVRWRNGDYHEGYYWCDHLAYRASNYRNWNQGTFREKQIRPLYEMIPELALSGTLHPDAWYNTPNPFYRISDKEDCRAMREMTVWMREEYNVDITTEFDRRRPENIDFVHYHPLLWHIAWDERTPPDPMKIPSYFMTGTNAKTWSSGSETVQSKFFGEMGDFEGIIRRDPEGLEGLEKEFATRTLPWYYLNRKLRTSFDGNTARFTGEVESTYPGRYTVKQSGNYLQDGTEVFITAGWLSHPEIIAFSAHGCRDRQWELPPGWGEVERVDIYRVSRNGLSIREKSLKTGKAGIITLTIEAGELLSIVPSGTNPDMKRECEASGSVVFLGQDTETHGNWIGKYGQEGFLVIGDSSNLPGTVSVELLNGADRIWTSRTKDIEALQKPGGAGRIAASRYHPLHDIVDIECSGSVSQDISLYLMDWERTGRWTVVDVIDAKTRKLIDSRNITRFGSGVYLNYRISGRVQIRLTNVYTDRYTSSADATFSALFFGIQ